MSDDRTEEIKRNILSPAQWIRILYMAFYAVACWVLLFVLPVIIICQIIISLITGFDNRNLREFGKALSDYFHQALDYLVYDTDDKPWPFSDGEDLGSSLAEDDDEDDDDDDDDDDDSAFDMERGYRAEETTPPTMTGGNNAAGEDASQDVRFTEPEQVSEPPGVSGDEVDLPVIDESDVSKKWDESDKNDQDDADSTKDPA